MCWAHVYRALDKNIKNYCVDITSCNEIIDDVMFLQLCQSQAVFQKVSELFLTKWQDEKHFCDYFTKEWLHKHPGWYEGYMDKYPSTNNALESCNNEIKRSKTLRERYPLSRFRIIEKTLQQIGQKKDTTRINSKIFQLLNILIVKCFGKTYFIKNQNLK